MTKSEQQKKVIENLIDALETVLLSWQYDRPLGLLPVTEHTAGIIAIQALSDASRLLTIWKG